jgi:hypothetical protein
MAAAAAASTGPSVRVLALIGGSSFLESSALRGFERREVHTPHGAVVVHAQPTTNERTTLYFVQRHAANPDPEKAYSPPHLINYRAIATALKQLVRLRNTPLAANGGRRRMPCAQHKKVRNRRHTLLIFSCVCSHVCLRLRTCLMCWRSVRRVR